jgi:Ca2+-binding EF-hand superfamily protein
MVRARQKACRTLARERGRAGAHSHGNRRATGRSPAGANVGTLMKKWALSALVTCAGLTIAGMAVGASPTEPRAARFGTDFFGRSDLNRDQIVTLVEARAGALRTFDGFDLDHDGRVTGVEASREASAWRSQRFEARFLELDRDRDGRLTREEVAWSPRLWARLDRDRDGSLTRPELQRSYLRQARRSGELGSLPRPWARWDSDHDGNVTRAEAVQGAEQRFQRRDRDGDGRLTRSEAAARAVRRRAPR